MIYDFQTKNESFIEMAYQLKQEGRKNWKFFLLLLDEDLVGVDPYDPNLSDAMKFKIQKEVINNYWYYIREVIKIPEAGGYTTYRLNKLNLAISYCMSMNLNCFIEGPRQSGKTVGINIRYTWMYNFGTINSQMAYSNKKLSDSILNLKRFKEMVDLLPDYLKVHIDESNDRNNLDYIQSYINKNSIQALSAPNSVGAAEGLGRGFTMPCLWYDEFAFLKFNSVVYAAAAPALSRAKEAAKKNGSPYGITISTTPNDRDSAEGAYAYSILDSAVRFDDTWYDKTPKEILNIIKNQSKNDFVYIKYHYYQLGRDEEWLKEQSRNLNNDLLKIKRELLLEWTLTNDRSPFSEEQLNTVQAYIKDEPIKNLYIGEYKFKVYEELTNMTEKNWLMAIDIGGGLSLDFTVISIIDPMNYKLKAIFRTNCIDAVELVKLVRTMLCTFFPEAVVIPERTGIGQGIVQMMMKDPVISRRLYYEVKDKIVEKKVEDVRVNGTFVKKKSKVKVYGQDTTASSRNVMFNEIMSYIVNESPESIICPELFDEMKTLERSTNRGNKIEAKQGAHDDVVMSYLIGLYALFRGTNIKKFVSLQGDYSEDDPLSVSPREERQKRIKRNMANLYYDVNNFSPGIQELMKQQNIILEDEKPEKEKKNYLSKVRKLLE